MKTNNGDFTHDSTGNALLEFFSKAGSIFKKKESYYGGEKTVLELFKPAWVKNNYKAMQLSMWSRDIRGGAGNRGGFRDIIAWLATVDSQWVEANLHMIPEVGRWDDLESLVGTICESSALSFWVRAIRDGNGLAAKWAPRADKNKEIFNKMRKIAGLDPKSWRKLIVKNTNVVETVMCSQEWQNIDFNKVPSVAMARYNKAFKKHEPARFDEWKSALEKGVDEDGNAVKVNASVLFPHDVIRTLNTDTDSDKLANAQFAALPNYMEGTDMRIMAICDFSGSMSVPVSGSVQAIDVSLGLGLYCSDKLGEKNPFYRKFIPFSNDSRLVDWRKETFSEAARNHNDGWCGSTNIGSALNKILESAQMFNATNDQIPNCLLILSDMQFDAGNRGGETSIETAMKVWEAAGYKRPKIVYWNLASYDGSPATKAHKDVALVSGFSPSVLKAVLGGTDFTPMAILERAIEKYKVIDPYKEKIKIEEVEITEEDVIMPKMRVEKGDKKLKAKGVSKKSRKVKK